MTIRIIVTDDHPSVLEGVQNQLKRVPQVELVGSADDAATTLELIRLKEPDFLLLDLKIPTDKSENVKASTHIGLETITNALRLRPDLKIVVMSASDEGEIIRQVEARGAHAFVDKRDATSEKFGMIIRRVLRGESTFAPSVLPGGHFTKRELQVVDGVAQSMSNKEIAQILGISEYTVHHHLREIYRKHGLHSRIELIAFAQKQGYLKL